MQFMTLETWETVRGAGEDLECIFYASQHEPNWVSQNVVGRILDGKFFEDFGEHSGAKYRLSLRLVATGDTNGDAISLEAH